MKFWCLRSCETLFPDLFHRLFRYCELKLSDLSTEEKALVKSILKTDISDDDINEMRNTIEASLREFDSMSMCR
jgi:hypothetical protein